MSNPTKSQQRFPFRTPVRVRRNYPKLPPITPTTPLTPHEDEPVKSSLSLDHINLHHEEISTDTRDFWARFREDIDKERTRHTFSHGNQQTPNKIVRIFVSSTFTDFFNEREVLIKKVFPALRDELEKAGIQIIDCDLRWGVPKDSTTEKTILACLEELDRCFEDNGQPFFIGLISDKYGWVPKLNELPENITERYRWIDGASITLMEFLHGAFRTNNPNALFFIRQSENVLKNLPEKYNDKFRDKDESSQKQIKELKSRLGEFISPEQIYSYDCFYNGLDSSSGRERVKIDGLQDFEEQAKKMLIHAIEKWYPENFIEDDSEGTEHKQMQTFLLNKTQCYVDRFSELATLMAYSTGNHDDLVRIEGKRQDMENKQPFMLVTGPSGNGKSMLLAKFILDIEEKMKEKCFVFYCFCDGGSHLRANHVMYDELKYKLSKYLDANNLKSSTTGDRLKIADEDFLTKALALISVPIIILVDGLDKGDIRQERKYPIEFPFYALTDLSTDHTYIIMSAEINSQLHKAIANYSHYVLELKPFSSEQRRLYIEKFFQRFNKTLESEQKSLLMNNKGAEQPLYLSYVCENLRQFGDYSLVTNRLQAYPPTIDELQNLLLNEAFTIIDNQPLVDAFFKLLIISNVGLLEIDIVNMLSRYINVNSNENNAHAIVDVNQMIWSLLRRHLKIFLDTTWVGGYQVIVFRHSTIEQKIRQRCLKEDVKEIRSLNAFLAEFYSKHSSCKDFASRRVPYHYDQASMYTELVAYLRSQESRRVGRLERQNYLRKRRCTKIIPAHDSLLNQRAYLCGTCAMQFKLGPYTMAKSSCLLCTNMIIGGNMAETAHLKREARFCQKHGATGYPHNYQCVVCKMLRPINKDALPAMMAPVPVNICFECWCSSAGAPRCCGFELD